MRRLPRALGLFDVSMLAAAAMGPAYSLASTLAPMEAAVGAYVPLALGGLTAIMLCVAIGFGQMSRFHPDAGSSYGWSARAFGRGAGAYVAWLLLLSNYFATMATALPAAVATLELAAPRLATAPVPAAIAGVAWIGASTLLLYLGARPTAYLTACFLIGEMLVLGATAVAAAFAHPAASAAHAAAASVPPLGAVATAMVLGIWMIDGWEVSASSSEETTGGARTAGRGGLAGLVLTSAVLVVAVLAYGRIATPAGYAAHAGDAMAYVAQALGGGAWRPVIVVTVLVSTAATLWTTVLYLSRSVYAMGRDGVLPRAIGQLDARGTPTASLLAVFASVSLATLATGVWPSVANALAVVLNGTAVFLGALFVASCAATIRSLAHEPAAPRAAAVYAPLAGAVGLAAIVAIDIAVSDSVTRAIECGGLLAGIPFAWSRARVPSRIRAGISAPERQP